MFRSFVAWTTVALSLVGSMLLPLSASGDPPTPPPGPAPNAQPASPPQGDASQTGPQAADPGPEAGLLRDLGGLTIPGLGPLPGVGQFLRPDGFDLPGGAGFIRRTPDQIGVHINTLTGPFEINIPRRQRAAGNLDEPPAPGAGTDAPLYGGSSPSTPRPSLGTPTAPEAGNPPGPESNEPPGGLGDRAAREFRISGHLFRSRNYPAVSRHVVRALQRHPGDRNLLQLRSLVSFALADYPTAYRDALDVLVQDDVWDWETLRTLYHSGQEYTAQYRALENRALANPKAADLWFLLAYHNLMLGNHEAARRQFERVASLDAGNAEARRLAAAERTVRPRGDRSATTSEAPRWTPKNAPPSTGARRQPPTPSGSFSEDLGQPGSLEPADKGSSKSPK